MTTEKCDKLRGKYTQREALTALLNGKHLVTLMGTKIYMDGNGEIWWYEDDETSRTRIYSFTDIEQILCKDDPFSPRPQGQSEEATERITVASDLFSKGVEQLRDCPEALEMARAILRGLDVSIRRYLRDAGQEEDE